MYQGEYYRSSTCKPGKNSCSHCHSSSKKFVSEKNRKVSVLNQPAKLNAPIKFTFPERIKLTLKGHRLKCKQLGEELVKMRSAIENHSEIVVPQMSNDFKTIFSGSDTSTVPDFMKLFWDEQQKYIYRPMFIKFCSNLAAKSSSAYSDLRCDSKTGNGILVLPS